MKATNDPIDYIKRLIADNGCVELRHHNNGHWTTGWFNDVDKMRAAIRDRYRTGNLYTSLNAPRIRKVANAMVGEPLRDDDVAYITRIPFDHDPVRPSGVCSTNEEMELARAERDALAKRMHDIDWPAPLYGKSGNGYHTQFKTYLPNNDETREIMRVIYAGMHDFFNTEQVEFDRTVRNPARIFRLYGTMNRKGENTPDRPWRVSTLAMPDPWRQVKPKQIEILAKFFVTRNAPKKVEASRQAAHVSGDGDYATLDIVSWFQSHGLYKRALWDGKHAVRCPWVNEHSSDDDKLGTDTVIWAADGGWPTFHCSHAHCAGRSLRDVMAVLGDADAFCRSAFREGKG